MNKENIVANFSIDLYELITLAEESKNALDKHMAYYEGKVVPRKRPNETINPTEEDKEFLKQLLLDYQHYPTACEEKAKYILSNYPQELLSMSDSVKKFVESFLLEENQ